METARSCCCSIILFNKKKEPVTKGSGILAKFTSDLLLEPLTPDALQGLIPGVKKAVKRAGKLESRLSTWAIFTCHSVIPGWGYLPDGELHFNGKQHKLPDIVSGCVSCCSEDSLLGPGADVLRSPHARKKCTIGLDFTILFLKEQAIEEVVGHLQQPVTIPCDRKPCDWHQRILPSLSDCEQTTPDAPWRLALYNATDTGVIQEHPISNCETCQPVPENQDSLENEIDKYVSMKQLKYEVGTQGVATPEDSLLSGAAIIHVNNENTPELVGFHVGDGVGNTIYGIIHLLQGGPAPVLGVFNHPSIRRLWATWWRYLLIPNDITLERMELKYLLELLHKLLKKSNGVQRIAQLDMLYPPEARIATLDLLSDIFNQFGVRRIDDATLTRCLNGECATFAEDLKTCVRKLLRFLVEVMEHLLKETVEYSDTRQIKNGAIEAYFRCLAKMMNFECDDIMREGLKKPIEGHHFEKLYRECCKVERERTDRCHECNAVLKSSKEIHLHNNVHTYFHEMIMKYNTRQPDELASLKAASVAANGKTKKSRTSTKKRANSSQSNQPADKNIDASPTNSRPHIEKSMPKEKIEGSRKLWGTLKATTAAAVNSTLTKLTSISDGEVKIKRKYKQSDNKTIRWWFVLKGGEDLMCKLESEWENVEVQTNWKIEPLMKFVNSGDDTESNLHFLENP